MSVSPGGEQSNVSVISSPAVSFYIVGGDVPAIRDVVDDTDLQLIDRCRIDAEEVVDLLLPENPEGNGEISVHCRSPGFRVTQRSGQQVFFNESSTSLGEGGMITALEPTNSIELIGVGVGQWLVTASSGNFEVD